MPTLNEAKYAKLKTDTGGEGTLNELECLWLRGLGYTGTLNEMYIQLFLAAGVEPGKFNGMYYQWLGMQGCEQDTLNERQFCYWSGGGGGGGEPMILETIPNTSSFGIRCDDIGVFNAEVDWGDGQITPITAFDDPNLVHTYAVAGAYQIKISGTFPSIQTSTTIGSLLGIVQIGDTKCQSFRALSANAKNEEFFNTADPQNVSLSTNFENMIGTTKMISALDFTKWNFSTSQPFTMKNMMNNAKPVSVNFENCDLRMCTSFNGLLLQNNGASATVNTTGMLTRDATEYNSMFSSLTVPVIDVLGFDMGAAVTTDGMFQNCSSVSEIVFADHIWGQNLTSMGAMFQSCSALTRIDFGSGFSTPILTNLNNTFSGLTSMVDWSFIGEIDTSQVTGMSGCFGNLGTTPRDIPLDLWEIGNCTDFRFFIDDVAGLTTAAYDQTLIAWDALPSVQVLTNEVYMGQLSKYTAGGAAEAARTSLIAKFGQNIRDGGAV